VHRDVAEGFLPRVRGRLDSVELRGCPRTRQLLPDVAEATEEDYYTEYHDLILSVRVVDSLEQAVEHIARYGSSHTDGIVSRDLDAVERFVQAVDSAVLTVNASTRLSDGGVFGLGAEIGISTDKLHARGPMGIGELTTYKWVVRGSGHLRS
jgi:glutamate-5-semialdehyde dehydrogenase